MEFKDTESQLEGIREIFNDAKKQDNWSLDQEMLFSYYFVDKSVDKLENLGMKLEDDGYDFVDVFELGDKETDESTGEYLLHIDRVEKHTPESLAQRNVEFQKLADEYEIGTYDGWEFGEVGGEEDGEEFEDEEGEDEEFDDEEFDDEDVDDEEVDDEEFEDEEVDDEEFEDEEVDDEEFEDEEVDDEDAK